jgi:hypothetical protein
MTGHVSGLFRSTANSAGSVGPRLAARAQGVRTDDAGMSTAEYAVGTVAACGFAGILYKLLTSDLVTGLITDLIKRALDATF